MSKKESPECHDDQPESPSTSQAEGVRGIVVGRGSGGRGRESKKCRVFTAVWKLSANVFRADARARTAVAPVPAALEDIGLVIIAKAITNPAVVRHFAVGVLVFDENGVAKSWRHWGRGINTVERIRSSAAETTNTRAGTAIPITLLGKVRSTIKAAGRIVGHLVARPIAEETEVGSHATGHSLQHLGALRKACFQIDGRRVTTITGAFIADIRRDMIATRAVPVTGLHCGLLAAISVNARYAVGKVPSHIALANKAKARSRNIDANTSGRTAAGLNPGRCATVDINAVHNVKLSIWLTSSVIISPAVGCKASAARHMNTVARAPRQRMRGRKVRVHHLRRLARVGSADHRIKGTRGGTCHSPSSGIPRGTYHCDCLAGLACYCTLCKV